MLANTTGTYFTMVYKLYNAKYYMKVDGELSVLLPRQEGGLRDACYS